MITVKDPIAEHNKKVCREIDEHNKNIPLKHKKELLKETHSYAESVIVDRRYFIPSDNYRRNWEVIFGGKNA